MLNVASALIVAAALDGLTPDLVEQNFATSEPVDGNREFVVRVGDSADGLRVTDSATGKASYKSLTALIRSSLEETVAKATFADPMIVPQQNYTPAGSEFTEVERMAWYGKAGLYMGGGDVPLLNESVETDQYKCATYVVGFKLNTLSGGDPAKIRAEVSRQTRRASRALWRRMAKGILHGEHSLGLAGVLSNPSVETRWEASSWFGLNAAQMFDAVMDAHDSLADGSEDEARPGTFIIGSKLYRLLGKTRFTDSNGETVLRKLKEELPHVKWVETHDMNGLEGGAFHGLYMYDSTNPDAFFADIVNAPTYHGNDERGFENVFYMWARFGGVKTFDAFANKLVMVPTA